MIAGCFATAGVLIAVIGYLFVQGVITSAITQTRSLGSCSSSPWPAPAPPT